ncbi:hypothetical protein [Streptomyces wuyuanensis]|uniref:hypothetical protein n=1 Tax=Streptomyces wuyuanensis TaxID=1196353 RepID=UPI00343656FF
MGSTARPLSVERAAAAVVLLTGVATTAILFTRGAAAPSTPAWLLPGLAALGAVVPPLMLWVPHKPTHRATLVAFIPAAACHAAVLGASGGWVLKVLLGLSIGVSVLVCVRATLLRAEASQDRPRNHF